MISVASVYQDVNFEINKAGGYISGPDFNGINKRAELKFLDWISGKLDGSAPQPYTTQKVSDWLSPLITTMPLHVATGSVNKPDDYYGWDNAFLLGDYFKNPECDEDDEDNNEGRITSDCNIPIELLQGQQFYNRCTTYIEGLAPSFLKPICKSVGNKFIFAPNDIGSITLEYIRYPKFAELKLKLDPIFNEEVPDTVTSINYEWNEYAREYLIWFIIDVFSNSTREQSLKQFNASSKP